MYLSAFILFLWGFWRIMVGGYTNKPDSWFADSEYVDPYDMDYSPQFIEYDSHPILNSLGIGGLWTAAAMVAFLANPSASATAISGFLVPLNLTWIVTDTTILLILAFTFCSVAAYTVRVTLGRQFKSVGVDLPPEAVAAFREKERMGKLRERLDNDPEDDQEGQTN